MAVCVGSCLEIQAGLLNAKVSPDSCNSLECRANGLYVPGVNIVDVVAPCIDIGITDQGIVPGTFCHQFAIGATPIISDDACNGFECRVDGMWAPQPQPAESGIVTQVLNNLIGVPMVTGNVVFYGNVCATITNTSTCCSLSGIVHVDFGNLGATVQPNTLLRSGIEISTNGGGSWSAAGPPKNWDIDTNGFAAQTQHSLYGDDEFWVAPGSLGPGVALALCARLRLEVFNGSLLLFMPAGAGAAGGEINWNFVPSGGCPT